MENDTAEVINMTWFVMLLAVGFVLFVIALIARTRTDHRYEIQLIDFILILAPVFLWLFATGLKVARKLR
jgi:glucan phosphoethanolaminetransferase (alkaline phosphatase superfamily)